MPEMPVAGEHHGHARGIRGGDDFRVAHRAARLDAGGSSGVDRGLQAVGEREHRVGGDDAACKVESGFLGFPNRDPRGIHAAHLAGSDAKGPVGAGVNDGVGFHVFHNPPAEAHRAHFLTGRRAFGDDFGFEIFQSERGVVSVHHHDATWARTDDGGLFLQQIGVVHFHETQVFLLLEQGAGVALELRGDDHVGENFGNHPREFQGQGAVADDHATERGLAVGFKGLLPRHPQILVVLADAARVSVLEDGHRGAHEIQDEIRRRLDVENVGVAEFLALHLGEKLAEIPVKRALLVRVVTVAELLFERQAEGEIGAGAGPALAEVVGDGGVVLRGPHEDFHGELLAQALGGVAHVFLHFLDHPRVVGGIDDDGHAGVVFRRTAQHRRAADVDFLDGFFERDLRFRDGFLERIKIHHHQIDGRDVVRLGLRDVLRVVAALEQSAVDFRVERLQPTVEKLGRAGEIRHVDDRQARLTQRGGGAAG